MAEVFQGPVREEAAAAVFRGPVRAGAGAVVVVLAGEVVSASRPVSRINFCSSEDRIVLLDWFTRFHADFEFPEICT